MIKATDLFTYFLMGSVMAATTASDKADQNHASITDEFKEQNSRYTFSKFEHDLYHEESDTVEKVIRVKRFNSSNKSEKWKIFEDNHVSFIIEGDKLTKKEREFLRSIDGFNFLIAQFKQGIKSLNHLKKEIKLFLTSTK
jgi:hypothetical protein